MAANTVFFFVHGGWIGAVDGSVGLMMGLNLVRFYYTSDGMNNLVRSFCNYGR
jgi:hypothetical protein